MVPIRPCRILHIEDNAAESWLMREALADTQNVEFVHAAAFETALTILRERSDRDQINLIIMDWNLPLTSGKDMLSTLKADPLLKVIPVIVANGSIDPAVTQEAYGAHASCVISKPMTLDGLESLIAKIRRFWLDRAHLPFCDTP